MTVSASGVVFPAGTLAPVADLPPSPFSVAIDGLDESGHVRCIYPDGFVKHHDASSIEHLLTQITQQLRGRYGAGDLTFTSAPSAIEAGAHIEIEV